MKVSRATRYVLVKNYLEKYPDIFTDFEKKYLLGCACSNVKFALVPDLVREVYDELGLLEDEENIYLGFIDLIQQNFDISDRKIVEVGGGVLPRLGERIALIQNKGNITVYDPRLSPYKSDGEKLKLVRSKFTGNQAFENVDFLFGFMPCEAADIIVDTATDKKIDFMIALCEGGSHGDEFDYFEDEEEWRSSLISRAKAKVKKQEMGTLGIEYMKKYGNPYPVIYNQREK